MAAVEVSLHPKQRLAFYSPATEVMYGGAAGGGKSFLMRISAIRWCNEVPGCQVYLFRRSQPDLRANHLQGPTSFFSLLSADLEAGSVKWSEQKAQFKFANGSILNLCHLQFEADLTKYHGAEIHVLLMDELTHFGDSEYRFLRSRVRAPGLKVPEQYKGRLPRIEAATNPGSRGHAWVKRSFVSPRPPEEVWRAPKDEGGMLRQYIPAKVSDNPTLTDEDPDYLNRLEGLGAPELVRAMRDGDWDIVAGQAFEKYRRETHVIEPFTIPDHWMRFRSMDWGSSKPFSVGWWAVSDGTYPQYPDGSIIRYREWYGWDGRPDQGMRLEVEEVAKGILDREDGGEKQKITYSVADTQIFSKDGGPSHAERFARCGVAFAPRDWFKGNIKDRKLGYQEMRGRMAINEDTKKPGLFVFSTCVSGFIRTIPDLVMDATNPEDVDTTQEDHAYDEVRYACMSRPYAKHLPSAGKNKPDRWTRAFARDAQDSKSWKTA